MLLQIYRKLQQQSIIVLLTIILRPLVAPGLLLSIVPFVLIYFIFLLVFIAAFFLKLPFAYAVKKLTGDNRLESIFLWWGIIFFITGNLLQFLSTF